MIIAEAAKLLGISTQAVYKRIERKTCKAQKIGRDWHIEPSEVERLRRQMKQTTTTTEGDS
jgi:excisionase family DNA binding protein